MKNKICKIGFISSVLVWIASYILDAEILMWITVVLMWIFILLRENK